MTMDNDDQTSVRHTFGMGQTVEAAIRLQHNNTCITKTQMEELVIKFKELNGGKVPKLGETFIIPIDSSLL